MKSIFTVTIEHMKSHIGRGIMIVVSIMFSAGLVYAVLNMNTLIEQIIKQDFLKDYGNATVLIHNQDNSPMEETFPSDLNAEYLYKVNNIIGYTTFESNYVVNMMSFEDDSFFTIYDTEYIRKLNRSITENDILIGEENASVLNLSIGDSVITSINGSDFELIVYGIIEEGASFLDYTSNTLDVVTTYQFTTDTLNLQRPNMVMIKANQTQIEELKDVYSDLVIIDLTDETLYEGMNTITTMLVLMASSVVLISAFIIYSTYKIIVIERLPLIGTLRSIGANKQFGTKLLLLESILYGFLGGLLGIGMGMLFIKGIMATFLSQTDLHDMAFQYMNISVSILTISSAILLSTVSSLVPILKIRNYTIKQVMFGEIKNVKEFRVLPYVIGTVSIIGAIYLLRTINYENQQIYSVLAMLLIVIGCVIFIPLLIRIVAPLLTSSFYPVFKNNAVLSGKNMKHDKTLINNIVLLATGLGVIFMINNFSASVGSIVQDVYKQAQFDIVIQDVHVEDEFVNQIKEVEGVEHTFTYDLLLNTTDALGKEFSYLQGTDLLGYHEYAWDDFSEQINEDLLAKYNNEDTIIITNFTAKKYEYEVGDVITFEQDGVTHDVEIIATVSSMLYNGNLNFMSRDTYQKVFGNAGIQVVYINTNGDTDSIKNDIKQLYMYGVLPVETLDEMETLNNEGNNMVFMLMKAVSLLAMLIGSIGIINNFTVSFLSRRKLVANLRSLGLSRSGTVKLFLIESFLTGITGSILGVGFGMLLYYFMGFVIESMNISAELMSYDLNEIIFVFVSGVVISFLAAILPATNIAKRNIVQEIKYEG